MNDTHQHQTTPGTYAAFVGIDRADRKIDTHTIDAAGPAAHSPGHRVVNTRPADLKAWVLDLAARFPRGRVAVCIEQPCAGLISFLSQYSFIDLYPINPATLKRWREAFTVSRAKDDKADSRHLAELVSERHTRLKRWAPDDPHTRKLRFLTEARRKLVDDRTKLTNRLTAHLKDHYPLALEVSGKDLHARLACDFLRRWPTLDKLKRAKDTTLREFYHQHSSRRPAVVAARIEAIAAAVPLTEDPAVLSAAPLLTAAIVAALDTLRTQIRKFDDEIAAVFAEHPDADIFASLPGAGPNFTARLAAVFGTDRDRYTDASGASCYTGVSPVTIQSGKAARVTRRFACAKFHRQTLTEWAGQTITKSEWARAFYESKREAGAGRYTALRALAQKWMRIIFRCWQNRERYDEARYLKALEKAGSPLVHRIKAARAAA